jgi:hypothetical protein
MRHMQYKKGLWDLRELDVHSFLFGCSQYEVILKKREVKWLPVYHS